jgi:CRP/FNR family transcriptional regulator, cyclic AMP receptor protein
MNLVMGDTAARVARLRTLPLFAELDEGALERVAAICTEIEAERGQILALANDPGSGMFVVEEGTVGVELRNRTVELGPGEFVGELSLLAPEATRVARVHAATPVRCLAIGRAAFAELLEAEPTIAVAMLPVLARRLVDEVRAG